MNKDKIKQLIESGDQANIENAIFWGCIGNDFISVEELSYLLAVRASKRLRECLEVEHQDKSSYINFRSYIGKSIYIKVLVKSICTGKMFAEGTIWEAYDPNAYITFKKDFGRCDKISLRLEVYSVTKYETYDFEVEVHNKFYSYAPYSHGKTSFTKYLVRSCRAAILRFIEENTPKDEA